MELLWGGDGPKELTPDAETRRLIEALITGSSKQSDYDTIDEAEVVSLVSILRRRIAAWSAHYKTITNPQAAIDSLKTNAPLESLASGTQSEELHHHQGGKIDVEVERQSSLAGEWSWATISELEDMPADETNKKPTEKSHEPLQGACESNEGDNAPSSMPCVSGGEKESVPFDPLQASRNSLSIYLLLSLMLFVVDVDVFRPPRC